MFFTPHRNIMENNVPRLVQLNIKNLAVTFHNNLTVTLFPQEHKLDWVLAKIKALKKNPKKTKTTFCKQARNIFGNNTNSHLEILALCKLQLSSYHPPEKKVYFYSIKEHTFIFNPFHADIEGRNGCFQESIFLCPCQQHHSSWSFQEQSITSCAQNYISYLGRCCHYLCLWDR